MTGTYGQEEKHSRRVLRGQLFSKVIVCFLSLPRFFNTFDSYCRFVYRALSVERICNKDKCCVVTHRTSDIRVA